MQPVPRASLATRWLGATRRAATRSLLWPRRSLRVGGGPSPPRMLRNPHSLHDPPEDATGVETPPEYPRTGVVRRSRRSLCIAVTQPPHPRTVAGRRSRSGVHRRPAPRTVAKLVQPRSRMFHVEHAAPVPGCHLRTPEEGVRSSQDRGTEGQAHGVCGGPRLGMWEMRRPSSFVPRMTYRAPSVNHERL